MEFGFLPELHDILYVCILITRDDCVVSFGVVVGYEVRLGRRERFMLTLLLSVRNAGFAILALRQ
jgi:hypothetical protein